MPDFGALTMVGLIATVLSIGFALAAFINSRRRTDKKPEPAKDDAQEMPILVPDEQAPGSARAAPAPYYSTVSHRVAGGEQSKPAFKQVQSIGGQSGQKDTSKSDDYLWE